MVLSKSDKEFLRENKKYISYYEADTGNTITKKSDVDDFEDWMQYNAPVIDKQIKENKKNLRFVKL